MFLGQKLIIIIVSCELWEIEAYDDRRIIVRKRYVTYSRTSEPSAIFFGKLIQLIRSNAIKSQDVAQNYEWSMKSE